MTLIYEFQQLERKFDAATAAMAEMASRSPVDLSPLYARLAHAERDIGALPSSSAVNQKIEAAVTPLKRPDGYPKRIEFFAGATSAQGLFTVVYPTPFAATPHLNPYLVNPDTETGFRVTAESRDGFTIHVFRRAKLTVLGLEVLAGVPTNLAGASVKVTVFGS